ncbi:MAG: hypothetical protein LBL52_01650 [Rickettsiales bacterium]|nr:hypothetical protein [Rickettsiales bacterium]
MPELCKAGAGTDFDKYNAPLTLAEATAAIGTPAKSRWTLVDSFEEYGSKPGTLSPGLYRVDASGITSVGCLRISQTVAMSKDTGYIMRSSSLPAEGNCAGCAGVVFDSNNATYSSVSYTVVAQNSTAYSQSYTPGITQDDFAPADCSTHKTAIYRLN